MTSLYYVNVFFPGFCAVPPEKARSSSSSDNVQCFNTSAYILEDQTYDVVTKTEFEGIGRTKSIKD